MNKKKGFFQSLIGTSTLSAGLSIIKAPLEMFSSKKEKKQGDNPELLKKMSFEELMKHWGIPVEEVPRLKKIIGWEMAGFAFLFVLGASNLLYTLFSQKHSITVAIVGVLVAIVGALNFLMRHHWRTILTRKKYITFKDYLTGK